MESEGPYTFYERADGRFMIEGPGIFTDFASEGLQRGFAAHLACNEVHRLNMVFALGSQRGFAEGRKAERERCAKIAENEAGEIPECMTGRIIAKKIRGGQDGK